MVVIPAGDGRAHLAAMPPAPEPQRGKGFPAASSPTEPSTKGKFGKKGSAKGAKGKDRPKMYEEARKLQRGKKGGGKDGGKDNPLKRRLQATRACRACGQIGHLEADCSQRAGDDGPPLKFRRPQTVHYAAWSWMVAADAPTSTQQQEPTWRARGLGAVGAGAGCGREHDVVTETMPEGTAIVDCGAALECIGAVAAAKTAQALAARGEERVPYLVDK